MTSGLYKGFSSYEYENIRSFAMKDVELVKMDLLNHIFTARGTRVMMPGFGTRIPTLVFEPLDDITLAILEEDLRYVFNYDPRVELLELVITPAYDQNTVTASARLLYVELNMTGTVDLNLEFGE